MSCVALHITHKCHVWSSILKECLVLSLIVAFLQHNAFIKKTLFQLWLGFYRTGMKAEICGGGKRESGGINSTVETLRGWIILLSVKKK